MHDPVLERLSGFQIPAMKRKKPAGVAAGGDKDKYSALRAVLGGRPHNFAPAKLRPAGRGQLIAEGN
jgi:hypothetical protein